MSEIPVRKCPKCGELMEYRGGPSDSNIFIMFCTAENCRYQITCYADVSSASTSQDARIVREVKP